MNIINKMIQIFFFIKHKETQNKSIVSVKNITLNLIINDIKSIEDKLLPIKNKNKQRKNILNNYNKDDFYEEIITMITLVFH